MQKFTRPLVREIDVAGLRVAVTLSETGISVRPIGSRRQPWQQSWTSVLSGLVQSEQAVTPSQLAHIVELLKAGPTAADTVKNETPAAPTTLAHATLSTLTPILVRLQTWLAKNRLKYREALLPPATPIELADLEQALEFSLPAELQALLSWHNGQRRDFSGSLEQSWMLMSAEEIAMAIKELRNPGSTSDTPATGWQAGWVPFLEDGAGNYLCLDTRQPGTPIRAYWVGQADHEIVAPSLVVWLEDFVTALERGEYHEDPERGELIRATRLERVTAEHHA